MTKRRQSSSSADSSQVPDFLKIHFQKIDNLNWITAACCCCNQSINPKVYTVFLFYSNFIKLRPQIDLNKWTHWLLWLIHLIHQIDWSDWLIRSIDQIDWSNRLIRLIDQINWFDWFDWKVLINMSKVWATVWWEFKKMGASNSPS